VIRVLIADDHAVVRRGLRTFSSYRRRSTSSARPRTARRPSLRRNGYGPT